MLVNLSLTLSCFGRRQLEENSNIQWLISKNTVCKLLLTLLGIFRPGQSEDMGAADNGSTMFFCGTCPASQVLRVS